MKISMLPSGVCDHVVRQRVSGNKMDGEAVL